MPLNRKLIPENKRNRFDENTHLIIILLLAVALYFVPTAIIMSKFNDLETENAIKSMTNDYNQLNQIMDLLSFFVVDYAMWDESYDYIEEPNDEYVDINVDWNYLELKQHVNMYLLVDNQYRVVFQDSYDAEIGTIDISKLFDVSTFKKISQSITEKKQPASGFFVLPKGIMMYSASHVTKDIPTEPSNGMLIVGRFMDNAELSLVFSNDNYRITTNLPDTADLAWTNGEMAMKIVDATKIQTFLSLTTFDASKIYLVSIKRRDIYLQGQAAIIFIRLALLVTLAIVSAVLYFSFLPYLKKNQAPDYAIIDYPNDYINDTSLLEILEASSIPAFITDKKLQIKYANNKFLSLFSLTDSEYHNQSILNFIENFPAKIYSNNQTVPLYTDMFSSQLDDGQTANFTVVQHPFKINGLNAILFALELKLYPNLTTSDENLMKELCHEIRTPLHNVLGYTDKLLHSQPSTDKRNHHLNLIHYNAEHIGHIIESMYEEFYQNEYQTKVFKQPFQLMEMIDKLKHSFAVSTDAKSIQFIIEHEQSTDYCLLNDRTKIIQILYNLINNAIRFTNQGFIKIKTDIKLNEHITDIEIHVIDSGAGIAEEVKANLFEANTQNKPRTRLSGLGIGLRLSKRLATQLGGDLILVESELNKGSHFVLKLQSEVVNIKQCQINEQPIIESYEFLKGKKIAIIDDDISNLNLLIDVLTRYEAIVKHATDGKSGIDLTRNWQPDIVLLDIELPKINGIIASDIIVDKCPDCNIIFISAYELSVNQSSLNSSISWLRKPFSENSLIEALQKAYSNQTD